MFTNRKAFESFLNDMVGYVASIIVFILVCNVLVPMWVLESVVYWRWIYGFNIMTTIGFFVVLSRDYATYKITSTKIHELAIKRMESRIRRSVKKFAKRNLNMQEAQVLLGEVINSLNAGVTLEEIDKFLHNESGYNLNICVETKFDSKDQKPFGKVILKQLTIKIAELQLWEN